LKERRMIEQVEAEQNLKQSRQRKRRIAEQSEEDQIYRTEKKW
jgi:hypothetical protein